MTDRRYITAIELADHDLTLHDVRRRCPSAVVYTARDSGPCCLWEDLADRFGPAREDNTP
jgi:hypothetical protein